jgi:HK97 family phage portal protein
MGFFGDLFAPVDVNPGVQKHALEPIVWPTLPGTSLVYQSTYSQQLALSVAAVYRARQMTADVPASLPVRIGDSLVPAPNASQTSQEFVVETILSLLDYGDAYWRVDGQGNMRVLPFNEVVVSWNQERTQRRYSYQQQHLRVVGMNPPLVVLSVNRGAVDLIGFGPMRSQRIIGLIAEQKWSQEFFTNGTEPTGIVTVPGEMTQDEADLLFDQWSKQTERLPKIMSGGMTWNPNSFSATDSDWVDTHVVGIGDVATLFGVPAALLNTSASGNTSSLTYANAHSVYEGWYRSTLFPSYVKRITDAWSSVIGQVVKFDPEELFLASLQERTLAAATLVNAGFEASGSVDVVGLPPIRHTGKVPTTVQKEEA